jgi:hypothetical protein
LELPVVDVDQCRSLLKSLLARFAHLGLGALQELDDTFADVLRAMACTKDAAKAL